MIEVLHGGPAYGLIPRGFRTAASTGLLDPTGSSKPNCVRGTVAASFIVVLLLVWLPGARAGEDQPGQSADDAAFDQGTALGRALFPEAHEPMVRLDKRYVKQDSNLIDYTEDPKVTKVPGLYSITEQAARELRRQGAGLGATGRLYSLADAMADALWRKQVVETFWGHLE